MLWELRFSSSFDITLHQQTTVTKNVNTDGWSENAIHEWDGMTVAYLFFALFSVGMGALMA